MFTHFNECNGGNVTFGDVNQSQIRGKCSVKIKGFLKLQEVLYMKDLKANLLSIKQICDNDRIVQFSKECNVFEENGGLIMSGLRMFDDCYGIGPNPSMSCH